MLSMWWGWWVHWRYLPYTKSQLQTQISQPTDVGWKSEVYTVNAVNQEIILSTTCKKVGPNGLTFWWPWVDFYLFPYKWILRKMKSGQRSAGGVRGLHMSLVDLWCGVSAWHGCRDLYRVCKNKKVVKRPGGLVPLLVVEIFPEAKSGIWNYLPYTPLPTLHPTL